MTEKYSIIFPLHLVNLLLEYREARFDLFHAGYPYQGEVAALGKNFPNVYVDLCWLHVISPWVARQTLHEWIETVPANKILGFGGDYLFVEGGFMGKNRRRPTRRMPISTPGILQVKR